mmetsp:Transcript_11497/g.18743  ORF Transcript_11497/g.18743 Transcript_11497/m.18743 type:complete len:245 (+) Transcript_11497:98-832(+)
MATSFIVAANASTSRSNSLLPTTRTAGVCRLNEQYVSSIRYSRPSLSNRIFFGEKLVNYNFASTPEVRFLGPVAQATETIAEPVYKFCGLDVTDVDPSSYIVVGCATCFLRDEEDPKRLEQVQILEPLATGTTESVVIGAVTSFTKLYGTTLGEFLPPNSDYSNPARISVFPEEARYHENFYERAIAAARTFKRKPEAMRHIAIGEVYDGTMNFSLEKKRILNMKNEVKDSDNVKQHENTFKVL